jgi:hypothetical protein
MYIERIGKHGVGDDLQSESVTGLVWIESGTRLPSAFETALWDFILFFDKFNLLAKLIYHLIPEKLLRNVIPEFGANQ